MKPWNERFPRLAQLHFAQWYYLIATALLLLYLVTGSTSTMLLKLAALSLVLATAIEMWQRFAIWWHSLLGKALILLFYAIVLNLSFAYAESIVNSILGIRPNVVPYSVNLTALLLAPAWTLIGSMLTLQFYSVLHLGKVVLLLMLRPFGVRSKHLLGKEVFPLWTLSARICYLPVVTVILMLTLASYFTGHPEEFLDWDTMKVQEQQIKATSQVEQLEQLKQLPPDQQKVEVEKQLNLFTDGAIRLPTMGWLNKLVASFTYHVESLSASSCKLTPPEHLVHINDYEVLVISPDAAQPLGYSYKVRICDSPAFPAGITAKALDNAKIVAATDAIVTEKPPLPAQEK